VDRVYSEIRIVRRWSSVRERTRRRRESSPRWIHGGHARRGKGDIRTIGNRRSIDVANVVIVMVEVPDVEPFTTTVAGFAVIVDECATYC